MAEFASVVSDKTKVIGLTNDVLVGVSSGNLGQPENAKAPGTGSFQTATGTTAQEPAATNGRTRYDTDTNRLRAVINGAWVSVTTDGHVHSAADITSGLLSTARGGSGLDGSSAANGSLLIGNGSGFGLATISATTNETTVANGAASITVGIADNATMPGNQALTIPVGTTVQEPAAAAGMIRYDTTAGKLRAVDGGSWVDVIGGVSAHALLSGSHSDTTVGTVARGDLIIGQGASATWTRKALGATGTYLKSDGTDGDWAGLDMEDVVSGTLSQANGGTNISTAAVTNGQLLIGNTSGNQWALANLTATTGETTVANGASSITLGLADDTVIPGNASVTIPTGTTGQQPAATNGMMRYDTSTGKLRAVIAGSWEDVTTATHTHAGSDITSGTVGVGVGGTGLDASSASNGQLLIGNGSGFTLNTLGGQANQISVSTGAGTSTIALASDPVVPGNGAITVPVGTTGQAPTAADGMVRYDTSLTRLRASIGGTWTGVSTDGHAHAAGDITSGQLSALRGGTGVDGSTASSGQVLIGNGTGFSINTLTPTANQIDITNGVGTITFKITDNPIFPGTGGAQVPSGTTAQEPAAVNGTIRYDSTAGKLRGVEGGAWVNLVSAGATMTIGGAISGGTANRGLYEDASNQLAESANWTFDGSTMQLNGSTVVTEGATQSLSAKTLVAVKIADLDGIYDPSGNEYLTFDSVGSAVNYVQLGNAATGAAATLTMLGGDANVSFNMIPKGTGTLQRAGNEILDTQNTATVSNKTHVAPMIGSGDKIFDILGNELLGFLSAGAAAVNYLDVRSANTGDAPDLMAAGSDANISINLIPKGSGDVTWDGSVAATTSTTQTFSNKTLASPTIDGTVTMTAGEVIFNINTSMGLKIQDSGGTLAHFDAAGDILTAFRFEATAHTEANLAFSLDSSDTAGFGTDGSSGAVVRTSSTTRMKWASDGVATIFEAVGYDETHNYGNTSSTSAIDFKKQNAQRFNVDQNTTFTVGTAPTVDGTWIIHLDGDPTGAPHSLAWPAAFKWHKSAEPTEIAANKHGIVSVTWDGTDYWCSADSDWESTITQVDDLKVTGQLFYDAPVTISASDVDCGLGNNFAKTLAANFTGTVSNAQPGKYELRFAQDATGGRTFALWTIEWPDNTEPTWPTAANDKWTVYLSYDGTTWQGSMLKWQ